jgi:VanZ family protein
MKPGARGSLRWALLWAAVIALLLLAPPALMPGLDQAGASGLDKVGHAFLFLVLALLAVGPVRARHAHPILLVIAVCIVYGALIEVVQGLSGLRDAEVLDVVADAVGSCAGTLVPGLWRRA